MENKNLLFCISAFLEIGRGTWRNHARTTEQYLNHFAKFWGNIEAQVTIFCEPYFEEFIRNKIFEFESTGNLFKSKVDIQIFERSELFHFQNIDRIRNVQSSQIMKRYSMRDTSGPPEYTSAEWTSIMLSKPHFLKMCQDRNLIPDYVENVAWTDFGIAHCGHNNTYVESIINKRLVEPRETKITFFNKRDTYPSTDPWQINGQWDDTYVVGGFYIVPRKMIDIFVDKFDHVVENVLLNQGIIDDDQTVMSLVGSLYPDLSRFEDSYKYNNNPTEGDFFPIFYTLDSI